MPIKPENYYLIRRHFYKIFKCKCALCGLKCDADGNYFDKDGKLKTMELDHIIPNGERRGDVSRSKREWEWFLAYEKDNLQLLCKKCNQEKGDRLQ